MTSKLLSTALVCSW